MSPAGSPSVVASVQELDPAVRPALRRHVLGLADSKRLMGIRYSDWVLGAPSIETDIATSAMAQDEWGHARLLYAMLKDFGDDPTEIEHDRPSDAYASVDPLDEELASWADVVAAMAVVDNALTVALEGFAAGAYEAARSRVGKMVDEEEFHLDLAAAWFRRLARSSGEGRDRLRSAVDAMVPRTLAWLAPDDQAFRTLVDADLVRDADALLQEFGERAGGILKLVDVDVRAVEPDRSGWDEARGRGPGAPAEEAVERARGDLNRALFVE